MFLLSGQVLSCLIHRVCFMSTEVLRLGFHIGALQLIWRDVAVSLNSSKVRQDKLFGGLWATWVSKSFVFVENSKLP